MNQTIQSQENPMITLIIKGLHPGTVEHLLEEYLLQYSPIINLRIVKNFKTKKSRGFAFFEVENNKYLVGFLTNKKWKFHRKTLSCQIANINELDKKLNPNKRLFILSNIKKHKKVLLIKKIIEENFGRVKSINPIKNDTFLEVIFYSKDVADALLRKRKIFYFGKALKVFSSKKYNHIIKNTSSQNGTVFHKLKKSLFVERSKKNLENNDIKITNIQSLEENSGMPIIKIKTPCSNINLNQKSNYIVTPRELELTKIKSITTLSNLLDETLENYSFNRICQ